MSVRVVLEERIPMSAAFPSNPMQDALEKKTQKHLLQVDSAQYREQVTGGNIGVGNFRAVFTA